MITDVAQIECYGWTWTGLKDSPIQLEKRIEDEPMLDYTDSSSDSSVTL